MTKATFFIRGTDPDDGKKVFKKQSGYLYVNGNQWFGAHNVGEGKTKEWAITHLPTGLRVTLDTFPSLKKAQEYIESDEPINILKEQISTQEGKKWFINEKETCSALYVNDQKMWAMLWRIYGWEYRNAQNGLQSEL